MSALMGGKEMKGSELRLPYAAYHFSTSGTAVAVATAVTHPLDEGVRALWKGVGPAMARASCLTASQLATYDESKQV
ncbi:hypothetical protein B296_00010008 [Ensete ventricosum]|uniref:Uncharacterized protein n=1 Tax=Ensete ventricosum TaxID=4639 RepID=A0A427A0I6_ENSVE|nr:hypothetical protein B296_00010008 [Ensete ventricosum]